jgi:two-component system chemotaxis response regulator CheB
VTAPLPNLSEPIRVLIVDDSPMVRKVLSELIARAPDMVLVGEASTGAEAVRMNYSLHPQVIAMDITIPILDGLQATRIIMQEHPTRVVLLGTREQVQDEEIIAQATAAGALDVCEKPQPSNHNPEDEERDARLIKILRALSQVGVVRVHRTGEVPTDLENLPGIKRRPEIVLIVSSTGGPHALETIIKTLPADFPLPIVIVQHISDEFVDNMTNWLDTVTPLAIKIAENGERPLPGTVYFAPIGMHLRFTFNGRFALEPDQENYRHVPSGDVLLESAAKAYGANGIGVVLTGMGMDGARGLSKMREQGAHTIVQDEATSIVFGMPKAAIDLGGSEYVVPLESIAGLLMKFAQEGRE